MNKSASEAVDNLLRMRKENAGLKKGLSAALNQAATDAGEFQQKLKDSAAKLVVEIFVVVL